MLTTVLTIVQIVLAIVLIAAVMIQQKGAGLGEAFGGSNTMFSSRRGIDLTLHRITIVVSILFFAIAVSLLVV